MHSWTPPPAPPGGNPVGAVENALDTAVDGAGEVVDAVAADVQALADLRLALRALQQAAGGAGRRP